MDYYASPTGLSSNSGAIGSPWDLATALANASQTSGDTLYLRGGTYYGKFSSTLNGGTVRSYPGEWAVVDGYVATTLNGAINSTQLTFAVTSAAGFPASGFEISIDREVLTGCSKSGNNITCTYRGASGSSGGAVAHSNGSAVIWAGPLFTISGNNTTYQNFEVKNSYPDRVEVLEHTRGIGFSVSGDNNNFINLIVHDNGIGIFTSSQTSNTLIYGCLIYNNGSGYGGGGFHGMNLYLENGAGYSRIYDVLALNSLTIGVQLYGQTGPYVGGDMQGTVIAGSGTPTGAGQYNLIYGPDSQISPTATVNESHFYHNPGSGAYSIHYGYGSGITTGTFTNNYVVGATYGFLVGTVTNLTVTGNKFSSTAGGVYVYSEAEAYTWNNNIYYNTTGQERFTVPGSELPGTWTNWRNQTGFDASSTLSSGGMPDTVVVRPNIYEIGRANIIVYAASAPSSINVDLATTGLTDNQAYTIKNAFDYFGDDVATGVYDAGSTTISLPLNGAALDVATPTGMGSTPATTVPQFGIFIVIPGAADVSAPGTPTGLTANVGQSSGATGTMLLAWTLGAGTETSVTVRRIVDGVTTDIPLAADITSYTDTGQTVGLSYTYAVKASNASGDSAWSDTAQEVLTGLTCFGAPPSIG